MGFVDFEYLYCVSRGRRRKRQAATENPYHYAQGISLSVDAKDLS